MHPVCQRSLRQNRAFFELGGSCEGLLIRSPPEYRRLPFVAIEPRQQARVLGVQSCTLKSLKEPRYLQVAEADYMLSLIDRGAEHLLKAQRMGSELCTSLKSEARRRVGAGEFFGFIGFVRFRAVKPVSR